ncbi:hypothetical protein GQR58_029269 [Nymphon striatum]|nr:hypothetical protein GQR58_029269 [Nymphon striatum]
MTSGPSVPVPSPPLVDMLMVTTWPLQVGAAGGVAVGAGVGVVFGMGVGVGVGLGVAVGEGAGVGVGVGVGAIGVGVGVGGTGVGVGVGGIGVGGVGGTGVGVVGVGVGGAVTIGIRNAIAAVVDRERQCAHCAEGDRVWGECGAKNGWLLDGRKEHANIAVAGADVGGGDGVFATRSIAAVGVSDDRPIRQDEGAEGGGVSFGAGAVDVVYRGGAVDAGEGGGTVGDGGAVEVDLEIGDDTFVDGDVECTVEVGVGHGQHLELGVGCVGDEDFDESVGDGGGGDGGCAEGGGVSFGAGAVDVVYRGGAVDAGEGGGTVGDGGAVEVDLEIGDDTFVDGDVECTVEVGVGHGQHLELGVGCVGDEDFDESVGDGGGGDGGCAEGGGVSFGAGAVDVVYRGGAVDAGEGGGTVGDGGAVEVDLEIGDDTFVDGDVD